VSCAVWMEAMWRWYGDSPILGAVNVTNCGPDNSPEKRKVGAAPHDAVGPASVAGLRRVPELSRFV
jgi:hypothetical protein